MAHTTLLITLLFIGGLIGWTSLAIIIKNFMVSRRKELEMIKDIKEDVNHVKSEIKKLK
jgi:hypothetical protein